MNKKMKIAIVLVIVLVLVAAAAVGYLSYQNKQLYNATYILIDDVEYERSITALDLSGKPIQELDKLKELTNLESLNLCDTGISIEQYKSLKAALPNCSITWSVPFQDTYYDNDIMVLDLATLSEADMELFPYFSRLQTVRATYCTDYANLAALIERYPNLNVTYNVTISGEAHPSYTDTLTIADVDLNEFKEKIQYLPKITTVNLVGTMPDKDDMLKIREAYPEIIFSYDFEVFGVAANSLDTFLDLSGMKFDSTEEVEAILPYFYNLEQVDMVNCGFSNDTMDALNKRHRDTEFVWTVNVCGLTMRTDTQYFMPVKFKVKSATSGECYNLRYCSGLEVIDLGHYGTSDISFVQYLPNLKYLLTCEATYSDATAISNCISLEYIEIQATRVVDFWPLTNLTNVRDLNIAATPCMKLGSYGPFGDFTPLLQMTWLDRLWLPYTYLDRQTRATIQEALPNTVIVFESSGATTSGYRYTPRYFQQRDILGMYYGTN